MYQKKNYSLKNCLTCKKEFQPWITFQKFCSKECNSNYHNSFYKPYKINLPTGTIGALTELIVSIDLIEKGFEIYRALSPASSCDILVLKNNNSYKFEVRTGYYRPNGTILYPPNNIKAENIAIVTLQDKKVHYIPSLDKIVAR